MKTTTIGQMVALNDDMRDMFPSLHNLIWEVVDSRYMPGGIVITIRNPNRTVQDCDPADFHVVR